MRSWQRCPGGPGKRSRQSPGRFAPGSFAVSSAGSIYPPDGNGIASGLFYRFWRVLVYMGETQGAAGHLAEEGSRAVRSRSTGRATSSKRRMAPISGLPKRRHDSRPRVITSAPCAFPVKLMPTGKIGRTPGIRGRRVRATPGTQGLTGDICRLKIHLSHVKIQSSSAHTSGAGNHGRSLRAE